MDLTTLALAIKLSGGGGGGGGGGKTAVSVDMSNFGSNGVIVETYADGSQKTYTMVFDSSGTPIKVLDSEGNETDLIGFDSMGITPHDVAEEASF